MGDLWCRRCKKWTGPFHRCFVPGLTRKAITPSKNPPGRGKIASALIKRIKDHSDLGTYIKEDAYCERLYHGFWQRSQGAWSWEVIGMRAGSIGSAYPMTEVLKWKRWDLYYHGGDIEIFEQRGEGNDNEHKQSGPKAGEHRSTG